MKVAFLCESSPGLRDVNGSRIDWVVVNLSPERVARLKLQIELANKIRQVDPTFSELQFKMNEVQVYDYFPDELDGEDSEKACDEAYDREWHPLADDLDLTPYDQLELKSARFCVCPAKGKRPATFRWLIHIKGEAGPGRTIKWRTKDLEQALRKAEALLSSKRQSILDVDEVYGFEPEYAVSE